MNCFICGATDYDILYQGKIRLGKPGHVSSNQEKVLKCLSCKVGMLDSSVLNYEDSSYREAVNGSSDVETYYKLHASEVNEKLEVVGHDNICNKLLIDVGCGAGAFLDAVAVNAKKTIAIDPAKFYHDHLSKKHTVYSYLSEVKAKDCADFVTMFAVVEHVENPRALLEDAYETLKTGGEIVVSTPNLDDMLLELLPNEYSEFFYRLAHKWYFSKESLYFLLESVGFKNIKVEFKQQYDVSNFMLWLRDKKPTGKSKINYFKDLDCSFAKALEKVGRSNFLYVKATK